jgi:hypothetical protein
VIGTFTRRFHMARRKVSPSTLHTARQGFAWYALNVLELPDHVVAAYLGHRDGGALVRRIYGRTDEGTARDRSSGAEHPALPKGVVTSGRFKTRARVWLKRYAG